MKKCIITPAGLEIKFWVPKQQWMVVLSQVKSLTGRSFDSANKLWRCPNNPENLSKLRSFGFVTEGGAPEEPKAPVVIKRLPEPQAEIDESLLPEILRPYQIQAVKFLEAVKGKGLLAMAPRLGKSLSALCYWMLHKELSPVLIVTPASGKIIWQREITKWTGYKSIIIQGTTPHRLPSSTFYIINYDIIQDWKDQLIYMKPQLFIIDEAHRISNPQIFKKEKGAEKGRMVDVQCTAACMEIGLLCPHVIELTGTPAPTAVRQLQTQLALLDPVTFGNRYAFLYRYCDPKQGNYGMTYDGLTHEEELIPKLAKVMFRRTKQDAFTDLPEEQHEFLPIEIDQEKYAKELEEFKAWYRKNATATDEEVEEKLNHFESLSYSAKRKDILSWISDFIDTEAKLVVFTHHRAVTEDIYKAFKKVAVISYGGMNPVERQGNIDKFNTDPKIKVFVGNVAANKEAISLSGADTVLYVELNMSAGDLIQSGERIWVAGMEREKLCYYYAIGAGTHEEKRVETLKNRARTISTVLDREMGTLFGINLLDTDKGK